MIDYVTTPSSTSASARVFHGNEGFTIEAVEGAPDHAELIDTIEDKIRESIANGTAVNFADLATGFIAETKRQMLSDLLLKLLPLLLDSDNIKLDLEVLISAAGLPIRDESDASLARRYGILRQTFSARKKTLLKKLGMSPPPHSKTEKACNTYKLTNRKNSNLQ